MKKLIGFILILGMAATSYAVPTLQVGAPAGAGDSGYYADYQLSLTNPTETTTARTSGDTIFVAGAFGPKDLLIGGQYIDPADPSVTPEIAPGTQGLDWRQILLVRRLITHHSRLILAAREQYFLLQCRTEVLVL